jgi:hypothetical protein
LKEKSNSDNWVRLEPNIHKLTEYLEGTELWSQKSINNPAQAQKILGTNQDADPHAVKFHQDAYEVGVRQMQDFKDKWMTKGYAMKRVTSLRGGRPKCPSFRLKKATIRDVKHAVLSTTDERNFYKNLLLKMASGHLTEAQLELLSNFRLNPIPLTLFDKSGHMRHGNKAKVRPELYDT